MSKEKEEIFLQRPLGKPARGGGVANSQQHLTPGNLRFLDPHKRIPTRHNPRLRIPGDSQVYFRISSSGMTGSER